MLAGRWHGEGGNEGEKVQNRVVGFEQGTDKDGDLRPWTKSQFFKEGIFQILDLNSLNIIIT
jgi:hypothetical protein